jgi:MoaA/NifB/PqqE/SkfB family radical SAM enzyme
MNRPRLQTLIVELTQACDHACLYCYNYWNHPDFRGPREPDSAVRALLAHVLDQVDCSHVTLSGGEPLLRPDLPEIVRFLAERSVRVTVITNGHRLTDSLAGDLISAGVGLFELPLLSSRREVHDRLCAAPGAFDAVLAALAHIRAHRGQAVVAFVATRQNIADLGDTLRLAYAFGARAL